MSLNSEDMEIILLLSNGNPGACSVVCKLFQLVEEDPDRIEQVVDFIKKLLEKNIIGTNLWILYKNNAELDINKLLVLDF